MIMPQTSLQFTFNRSILSSLLTTAMFLSSGAPGHARNGFIPHYVGAEGIIAGAGTALPLDATSTIANPAALSRLSSHFLLNIGTVYQNQHLDSSKSVIGNPIGRQKNQTSFFFPPTLGFNIRFNPEWALGFAATGGGGFVKFNSPTTNPAGLTPANGNFNKETVNSVVLTATTVSYRPTPEQSYGISLLVATSTFKSDLAIPPAQTEVTGALRSNTVFGVGTRIGGIWDVNKYLTLGASAATPVYSQEHKKYSQLFGKYHFEIPATARLGLTWHITPRTDFCFDFKELFYGYSRWVNQGGQGWHNQVIILTGIMHQFTDNFTAGIGYNYGKTPINSDKVLFNALSIPLDEHHISGGIRYIFDNKKTELFVMGYVIPRKKMTDNGQALPGGVSQGITIDNMSAGAEIGIKYNF